MLDSFNSELPEVNAWVDLVIQNKVWRVVITMHGPPPPYKWAHSNFSTDNLLADML